MLAKVISLIGRSPSHKSRTCIALRLCPQGELWLQPHETYVPGSQTDLPA